MSNLDSLKLIVFTFLTLLIANAGFYCPFASAGEAATDQAIVDLIKHANIINPVYKLTASVSDEEALITTQKKTKGTDAECKIQAVLIAKTAFEAIPERVQRVKVIFLDYDADASSSVVVKRAEVKLFGSGGLSEKDLLSSLTITTSSGSSSNAEETKSVQEGPAQADRLLLLGRIENLKKQGTNVSAFMAYFNQIEQAAKSDDEQALNTKITYLREHLADQEKMLKQAHAISTAVQATTGSHTVDEVARQFSAGQINPAIMQMAVREITLKNRFLEAASHGKDISAAQRKLLDVDKYMNSNQVGEANKIMSELEAQFH